MAFMPSFSRLPFFFILNLLFFTHVNSMCKCPSKSTTCSCTSQPANSKSSYDYENPKPIPPPPPPCQSTIGEKCPRDALQIGICAKLLNKDLLEVILGKPPITPCCSLVEGLVDLEVAVCLCTALKASVLGINLNNIPVSLNLLAGNCGREIPTSFQCP